MLMRRGSIANNSTNDILALLPAMFVTD